MSQTQRRAQLPDAKLVVDRNAANVKVCQLQMHTDLNVHVFFLFLFFFFFKQSSCETRVSKAAECMARYLECKELVELICEQSHAEPTRP